MVKHKIRDFMIIMISVFTLVSCRGYVFIPIQGGTEDVRALRISADDAYDIKLGDQGAMNAETIEVLYSDGSTKMRSIASLAADKTIFEKSGITEDVLLKEGGAEAYTDIFVYDITLSEMQEKMTEMIASGQGSELRNFCDGAYVLVDENSLAKGPLTAVESIAIQELGVSYPAFYNTFFRGSKDIANALFGGGIKSWETMADIEADKITFDNIRATLTALNGSENLPEIKGIEVTGTDAIIMHSSIGNVISNDSKVFYGIYVNQEGSAEINDNEITGFDIAIAVKGGEAEIKNVSFDGIIAIMIEDVFDFDKISLTGCTAQNDRTETEHDVIIVGEDDVVGTDSAEANAWFEKMKELNPDLVFGSTSELKVGGATIEGWKPVDGGDVEAT